MDASGSKQVVRDWFAVFNTGDVTEFDRLHSTSCRNHAPAPFELAPWPADGREFGPEAAAETVTWLRSNQPDLHVTIESMVAEDDQVVAWVHATGTPSGPGPIPPTGRSVDFHQAHRFRLRDGQVVEHWAVRDDLRSMLQAGVLTPPVRPADSATGAPR